MSWTIVDDNGVFQVRASISVPDEMQELIDALLERQTKLIEKEKKDDE